MTAGRSSSKRALISRRIPVSRSDIRVLVSLAAAAVLSGTTLWRAASATVEPTLGHPWRRRAVARDPAAPAEDSREAGARASGWWIRLGAPPATSWDSGPRPRQRTRRGD